MLTGKAKEQFEKWIMKSMNDTSYPSAYRSYIDWFYDLPQSMQFGVVQDYADSIGKALMVYRVSIPNGWHIVFGDTTLYVKKESIDEARKAAIKAFDEIVNRELN